MYRKRRRMLKANACGKERTFRTATLLIIFVGQHNAVPAARKHRRKRLRHERELCRLELNGGPGVVN